MKRLCLLLALLLPLLAVSGPFTIVVEASLPGEDVVTLYRYDDLFTLRTILVTRNTFGGDGTARLEGDVSGTVKMQLRIGNRSADLFVREGSTLRVAPLLLATTNSINGTTRMELEFRDLPPLDINALTTDVNERIDAFIAEDLATDEQAGMQALTIQRKEGGATRDSTQRPATLFVTPLLSQARIDSFSLKLRRFYAGIDDPWFATYVEHGLAGLQFGPRVNERELFDHYLKGRSIAYTDPEYVRFLRNLFADALAQVHRYHGDTLRLYLENADLPGITALFQRNDLLRGNGQLAELVLMDQLYLNRTGKVAQFDRVASLLKAVEARSTFPEHRAIAKNMVWDMLTMRAGTALPPIRLEDLQGKEVILDSLLKGPVCLAFTAAWCTYCEVELAGLEKLHKEYPGVLTIIGISLDKDRDALKSYRKAHPGQDFLWLHAVAEQQAREDLRLRSLPEFLLLNDAVIARSPAPLPSNGLGALFQKAKVSADEKNRIKVWDE